MKMIKSITLTVLLLLFSFGSFAAELTGSVNINTATQKELSLLPGIGESKAHAIIEQRKMKNFSKKEELLLVKGVGEKLLTKLSPYITVTGQNTLKEIKEKKSK